MKGSQKIERPQASFKVQVFREEQRLRYLVQLDTVNLEPTEYVVSALMPDHEERSDPYIYATLSAHGEPGRSGRSVTGRSVLDIRKSRTAFPGSRPW